MPEMHKPTDLLDLGPVLGSLVRHLDDLQSTSSPLSCDPLAVPNGYDLNAVRC
jgi:hypothetical protein